MLSLSLTGLSFFPALFISIAMMVNAYRKNPYDFCIMSLLLFGSYGLTDEDIMPVKPSDICVVICFALFLFFKKAPIVRTTIAVLIAYAALFFCFAFFSDEKLSVQVFMWRRCLGFSFFILPIVVFSRRKFTMMDFWNRLMPYVFIACIFYILDAYLFCGNVLMPGTLSSYGRSTFYDLYASPLSFRIFRKYPPGLFPMILLIYPACKYFKFKPWQWTLIGIGLLSTQTFSILIAYFFTYLLFRFGIRRFVWVVAICVLSLVPAYYIDGLLPGRTLDSGFVESKLRIKSSIDQIMLLQDVADDEDLANFASGRMAGVIPRLQIINDENRQLTGLGFLHSEKNTVKRYEIVNEYFSDISNNEEVVAEIEIAAVQVYIWAGWLGLIIHCLWLLAIYLIIRKLPESPYLLSVFVCCIIAGFGGFATLITPHGIFLAAMAFSAVILANRDRLPGFPAITR